MVSLVDKLEELLQIKFQEEEHQHLFLVEIKQLPGEIVHVYIDSDQSLFFDHCVMVSRYLEEHIEENGWLGEKYTIDVSSPGIDAPLKLMRQYMKNIGREVSVSLKDDHKNAKGKLSEVKENSIVLTYEEKVRVEGKKKKELIEIQREIALDNIEKTIVKISFK